MANATTQTIDTVAGTGSSGFSGDGAPATSTSFCCPNGLAIDGSGNVFFSANGDHRVLKIAAGTGIITTVAGTGAAGFSGDGGPATSAQLNAPEGVALDANGNLFIDDTINNRIRKVVLSTGIITTVVGTGTFGFAGDGGPATSAQIAHPRGSRFDASGNLFIADSNNHRIRMVAAGTEIITTVAGSGPNGTSTGGFGGDGGPATSAQLNQPRGVALDASGNLFIADHHNHRVRMVAAGTGIITTVAGSGPAGPGQGGFAGDEGLATGARLNAPNAVLFDASGNLHIADTFNDRIRKVIAGTGIITTVAGTGTPGFSGDGGPATSAQLSNPQQIAFDDSGSLLIADAANHRIRVVQSLAQCVAELAASQDQLASAEATIAGQTATIADQGATIADQAATIASQSATIAAQTATIANQTTTIASQSATIANQTATIADQAVTIANQTATIAGQTATIASQAATIESLVERVFGLPPDSNVATAAREVARATIDQAIATVGSGDQRVQVAEASYSRGLVSLDAGDILQAVTEFRQAFRSAQLVLP